MRILTSRQKFVLVAVALLVGAVSAAAAEEEPQFRLEFEAGAVWQTSNDVQIPNNELGTRFSLEEG